MKKSILSLGKTLNKEAQRTVNGGGNRPLDFECFSDRSCPTDHICNAGICVYRPS